MIDKFRHSASNFFKGEPSRSAKMGVYRRSRKITQMTGGDHTDRRNLYKNALNLRQKMNQVGRAVGTVGVGGGLLYAGAKGIKNAITKAPTLESQILEMQLNIFKYNKYNNR